MFSSIALGGGGVRGGLHVGALAAIEKIQGNLQFPDGIYGCSIGSIVATAVAFGLQSKQIQDMFNIHMSLTGIIPELRLSNITDFTSRKGLFTMDLIEKSIIEAFRSQNIDLVNKTLKDAPQKLFIVASNMTTRYPTIFQEDVPILEAIKCSSCLPLIFEPQVLYNHVYLDGGIMIDSLDSIVPNSCLVIHISESGSSLYANELKELNISTYMYKIYRCARKKPKGENVLWLRDDSIHILQQLTDQDKQHLYDQGFLQTTTFFTQRLAKELH
jgi:NTE family protein